MLRPAPILATFCLACALVLGASACGQKGPLKLPDPAPKADPAPEKK